MLRPSECRRRLLHRQARGKVWRTWIGRDRSSDLLELESYFSNLDESIKNVIISTSEDEKRCTYLEAVGLLIHFKHRIIIVRPSTSESLVLHWGLLIAVLPITMTLIAIVLMVAELLLLLLRIRCLSERVHEADWRPLSTSSIFIRRGTRCLVLPGWLLLHLLLLLLLMVWVLLCRLLSWKKRIEIGCSCVWVSIVDSWLPRGNASEHRLVLLLVLLLSRSRLLIVILLRVWVLWLLDVVIHIKWIVLKHFFDVYCFPCMLPSFVQIMNSLN